jgi:hypothetical protein
MMAMLMAKAKAGDAAAIRDVNFLRSIGFIEDEPKVVEETPLWELLDMCVKGAKQRKRDYWLQKHQ